MAVLEVVSDVSVHARPVEALVQAFFGLENAVMSAQQLSMGLLNGL